LKVLISKLELLNKTVFKV